MKNKTIFILSALLVFVLSAALGYYAPARYHLWQSERAQSAFVPPAAAPVAADAFIKDLTRFTPQSQLVYFPAHPITDIKGRTRNADHYFGRPLLINMWATWCAPCITELPTLAALAELYKGKMDVMAISLDNGKSPAYIADFLEKRKITPLAGYLDQDGNFIKKMGVAGLPTSFLIGRDGRILYVFEGEADWSTPAAKAFFDTVLLQNK